MQADPNNHFSEPIESSMKLPTITGGGKVEVITDQLKIPVFKDGRGKLYIPLEEFKDFLICKRDREQNTARRWAERLDPATGHTIGKAAGYDDIAYDLENIQSQAEGMPSAL